MEIYKDENRIYACNNGDYRILLGSYDTEERASEVFEEIHKAYTGLLEFENHMKEFEKISEDFQLSIECGFIKPSDDKPTVIFPNNIVYYMPIS